MIFQNSQQNGDRSKQAPPVNSQAQQTNCLREIDLSMNHNGNHMLKVDEDLDKDNEYDEQDPDYDSLSEAELNVDETEAMKQLGYCIHRITYFKLYNEQIDTVKCSSCEEVIGKTVREDTSVVKLEFTCNYCDLTFDLIGDLNMHLINHYHEIETGRPVLYET